jgi:hypothetical protein
MLGQTLILHNLDVVLSPPTCWPAQEKNCALMQEELEGLHRARASVSGEGWLDVRGRLVALGEEWGAVWGLAEEIGGGGGVGTGWPVGAHRDQAEAAEQDQRLPACTGSSAKGGTGARAGAATRISADMQVDLACQWLYVDQAPDVGCLGGRVGRRWTGSWRARLTGAWAE